jgi:hypothetical protein
VKLKLLKVMVQPHFVVFDDEGEIASEIVADPVPVSAKEWPTYAATSFQDAFRALVEQYEQQAAASSADADPADPA